MLDTSVISSVLESSIPKPRLSSLALRVLEKRYLLRDFSGRVSETPDEMFRRVASAVARSEQKNYDIEDSESLSEDFYRMLSGLEFLPNSPALLNAGLPSGLLSSCFALPISDSTASIAEALKATAYIHKSGGSIGFNLSSIRPAHDRVGARAGVAGGPVALIGLLFSHRRLLPPGRHQARLQHRHPVHRPPGHPRLHCRQGRSAAAVQLLRLGGRDRLFHGEGKG